MQAAGDEHPPLMAKGGSATAVSAPDPSSALLHSLRSWRDGSRAATAAAAAPGGGGSAHSRRGVGASTVAIGSATGATAPASAGSGLKEGAESVEPLTLDGFRIILGPDLRVAWFPFLQVSLASPHIHLSGPAVPEKLQVQLFLPAFTFHLFLFSLRSVSLFGSFI